MSIFRVFSRILKVFWVFVSFFEDPLRILFFRRRANYEGVIKDVFSILSWNAALLHFLQGQIHRYLGRSKGSTTQIRLDIFSHMVPCGERGGGNEVVTTKKKISHITAPYLWETFSIVISFASFSSTFWSTSEPWPTQPFLAPFCLCQKDIRNKKMLTGSCDLFGKLFFFWSIQD